MSFGMIAVKYGYGKLPLQVLRSGGGWYIGTFTEEGPISRESEEYWSTEEEAQKALVDSSWTQRLNP